MDYVLAFVEKNSALSTTTHTCVCPLRILSAESEAWNQSLLTRDQHNNDRELYTPSEEEEHS